MIKVLTWLWEQNPPRHEFNADKVNRWARQMRKHLTIPHTLACVTDIPEGIDDDIEIIPLPNEFRSVSVDRWSESSGAPQCYVRLNLWRRDAAEVFGSEWLVSMDCDMIAIQSLDPLFTLDHEVRLFNGTGKNRPYNGGLVMLKAGARPQVFEEFARDPEGVASTARELMVGSDQAVISMILGKGEATFGEEDGVYYFSQRVIRLNGGMEAPPRNMRMLFFPGAIKPWNDGVSHQWMKDAWDGYDVKPGRAPIHVYQDRKGWCDGFIEAAEQKGISVQPFSDTTRHTTQSRGSILRGLRANPHSKYLRQLLEDMSKPPVHEGAAFVRLDQQGQQRSVSKRVVEVLAERGVRTLPTLEEARFYDDKALQLPILREWMPETWYVTERAQADPLVSQMTFPLVSKAKEGAGSANVRLLDSPEAAKAEIESAWGAGIELSYGRRQTGYVYWQAMVPGNDRDYRVCVTGDYFYGLVRRNRPDDFRASGSGDCYPLTLKDDRERKACEFCLEIAEKIGTRWMAFDVVYDGEKPYVLEMSSAWTMKAYEDSPLFTKGMVKTEMTGEESFGVAVDLLCELAEQW